ncbi:MAG: hypothetical protein GX430_00045, partial [Treponema sp.]|nr:hypothetical protein [Treponema sp.]
MIKRYAALVFAVLLLASCASSPAQGKAPAWTLTTPPPDGTYTYFVGYSADPSGDAAKAAEGATANLLSSIMNYIGVKITVDSSATARASYDSYQAEIVQTVRTQSTNRLAGFMVKDRYQVKEKSGRVTVYILASYVTKDLEAEKTRIQRLFQEQIDAVAVPERKGQSFESEGRYFEAVQSYIEAAVAASGADIDNADIKLERNVNNARRVLQRLRFVAAGPAPTAGLGRPFSGPFSARLVYGENDSGPGIPGAEAYVTYQVRQASGRLTGKTERIVSDSRGAFSFTPPPPNFVGKAKLVMRINLDSSLDLLDKFPAKFEAFRAALETELRGRSIEFEYTVVSIAKDVATGIALADLDEKGAAI